MVEIVPYHFTQKAGLRCVGKILFEARQPFVCYCPMLLINYMDSLAHIFKPRSNTMLKNLVLLAVAIIAALSLAVIRPRLVLAEETKGSFVFCYQGEIEDHRLVVVDKSLQRTLVFMYVGDMVLVDEYPCGTGERQGGKTKAGDEKTPEGVYFITHRYQDNKVTIFGDRALHLDYPNAIDRTEGRMGDGIYIHGTNKKLKPRSSNGCITLANNDLGRIGPVIRDQSTPVLILNHFQLPTPKEREAACQFLQELRFNKMATGSGESPGHDLALRQGKGRYKGKKTLENKLALFDLKGKAKVRTEVIGTALWRAGDQWVVLANLKLSASKKKSVRALRRMYFNGTGTGNLALVRSQWILDDIKSAKMLASWLPAHTTVASTAPVKTRPVKETNVQKPTLSPEEQIRNMLQDWLAAWQNKRLNSYMSFYAGDFKSGDLNKRAWQRKKAHLNKVYNTLKIHAKNIDIAVNGDTATVRFTQYYKSDWHSDVGVKTISLVKKKGRWQILREDWEPLVPMQETAKNAIPIS